MIFRPNNSFQHENWIRWTDSDVELELVMLRYSATGAECSDRGESFVVMAALMQSLFRENSLRNFIGSDGLT